MTYIKQAERKILDQIKDLNKVVMNVLTTALELAFVSSSRFAIVTGSLLPYLENAVVAHGLKANEVDLVEKRDQLNTLGYYLNTTNVLILRNVQKLTTNEQRQIYEWLDVLDNKFRQEKRRRSNDKLHRRAEDTTEKEETLENDPSEYPFTVILVVHIGNSKPKVYQNLKEKFLFSINCHKEFHSLQEIEQIQLHQYDDGISKLIDALEKVFVHPDIKKFIYSLVVQLRNHRLTSLSPKTSRLPTFVLDYALLLTIALVVWKSREVILSKSGVTRRLFATPDFAKLAFRKVAYWLIDWEMDFDGDDILKSLEINMLTGDWYGSDYKYVKEYIRDCRGVRDDSSPTGYTNRIVEDTIAKVAPPM